ncbi:MAG: hypothetical protein WC863_01040 [Patescibacteria group bacterium]
MGKALKKIFFILSLTSLSFFVLSTQRATATSTLRGAAWWGDQYEFLYFNCLDDVMGDHLDVTGNLYALPEPRGFHFYSSPCSGLAHGVLISDNGNFSGAAWNYSLGLVSFGGTSTPPSYTFNTNCPSTCNATNNCWACYREANQRVYGWAKVDNGNTWLELDSTATLPTMIQSWNPASSSLPGHDIPPGDFVGYASSPLGDLSFNCENTNPGPGSCYNYKVRIDNLQVGYMSAPNWSYSEACLYGALNADLRWKIKSGEQAKYEVVVNTGASFNTSTHDYICWSGVQDSTLVDHFRVPSSLPGTDCPSLAYDTAYYWWIRLYDTSGRITPWYQYGSVTGSDGQTTFRTYKHEFPSPYFSWAPFSATSSALVSTTTDFTSNSNYYPIGNNAQSCWPSSNCNYLWTTSDEGAIIDNPSNVTTSIVFMHATNTSVSLAVTDSDSYVCSTSTTFTIYYGLPLWQEVKAN